MRETKVFLFFDGIEAVEVELPDEATEIGMPEVEGQDFYFKPGFVVNGYFGFGFIEFDYVLERGILCYW